MISIIRTAVILVLLIDFLQLLGGGKEYERFIRLVTGLLIACSLVAGILRLTGRLSEDTWLSWLEGEASAAESLVEENAGNVTEWEEDTEKNAGAVEIGVPLVEEIPEIVVEEIEIGGE
ncbi:MAG: stage III sporulation protein AF [Lachnospiraceae bacterium]|nr:stage III sporulation protein AF [Lachnospiraceae bacterium]